MSGVLSLLLRRHSIVAALRATQPRILTSQRIEPQLKPSIVWHAIARANRMGQSETEAVHRLMVRGMFEERIVELPRQKTEIFRTDADDSAMREASSMATDADDSLEAALERLLEREE